jgi:hypothetical protein
VTSFARTASFLLTYRIVLLIDLFAAMSVNQRRARLTLNDKKEHQ